MKIVWIFVSLLCLLSFSCLYGQQKHALLIGISEYEDPNWNPINAGNDTVILKEALLKRGFNESEIHCYGDKDNITRSRIIELIEQHLIDEIQPGDIAYFHFSGHGQQIPDQNNEELDGLDEALVMKDAPGKSKFIENGELLDYQYDRHLRDDELGDLLNRIRQKLGPEGSLMVTIDACHSGTATRAMIGPARGTTEPNVPEGWSPPDNAGASANGSEESLFGLGTSTEQLAPMTCIFASSSEQLNMEYGPVDGETYYGSLSYAISSVLSTSDEQISCKSLFAEVKSEMNKMVPGQQPQSEGPLEIIAFGGKLADLPQFFEIAEMEDANIIKIRAGRLSGIQEGAKIAFYPADTWDTTGIKPGFLGQVIESGVAVSRVRIKNVELINHENLQKWWAIPFTKGFGSLGLKVGIYGRDGMDISDLKKELTKKAYLTITDGPSDLIIEYGQLAGEQSDNITLTSSRGEVIFSEKIPEQLNFHFIQEISKVLEKYARYRWLQRMSSEQPGINAQLRIAEYTNGKAVSTPFNMKDSIVDLHIGKKYQLDIKNLSLVPAYYSIYYLPPRVDMESLKYIDYYNKGEAVDRKLKPFSSHSINPPLNVGPPPAYEYFLLVVSTEPIHWDPAEQTRGQSNDGASNSITDWYADRFSTEDQSSDDKLELISDNIAIYPVKFRIVE